jgi:hypothetical protein
MHIGMLWFDNTPNTSLRMRIEKAVDYYRKKYHQEPNLCLIHPGTTDVEKTEFGQMTIRDYKPVLPGHLWIGVEDKN